MRIVDYIMHHGKQLPKGIPMEDWLKVIIAEWEGTDDHKWLVLLCEIPVREVRLG